MTEHLAGFGGAQKEVSTFLWSLHFSVGKAGAV